MSLFMVLEGEDKFIKMDSFICLSSMLEDKCRISTSSSISGVRLAMHVLLLENSRNLPLGMPPGVL